ncbi:MAG: hypothetical protein H6745_32750 [Deltaproteobacteria bacterium]|nr:hypothetical protein [Deltaproteobacteria bacterium]
MAGRAGYRTIERAPVPGGGQLTLAAGPLGELVVTVDGRPLMGSEAHGSEEALARLTLAAVAGDARRVLVGGLGVGFTLAAALAALGEGAEVVVAELVPAVVRWGQGALGAVAGWPLRDARVAVFEGDVADCLAPGAWDAILLDVDNGPLGLTRPANGALYGAGGLAALYAALSPGGALGVWGTTRDAALSRGLAAAGLEVVEHEVAARGAGGARHRVWVGRRAAVAETAAGR